MHSWKTIEKYPLIITPNPPHLFHPKPSSSVSPKTLLICFTQNAPHLFHPKPSSSVSPKTLLICFTQNAPHLFHPKPSSSVSPKTLLICFTQNPPHLFHCEILPLSLGILVLHSCTSILWTAKPFSRDYRLCKIKIFYILSWEIITEILYWATPPGSLFVSFDSGILEIGWFGHVFFFSFLMYKLVFLKHHAPNICLPLPKDGQICKEPKFQIFF